MVPSDVDLPAIVLEQLMVLQLLLLLVLLGGKIVAVIRRRLLLHLLPLVYGCEAGLGGLSGA